ncbi:TatD family hydrolase [Vreelandella aquamarina]|uniref:TatD family hydrolase n=1 Tax=Vreelandella aquamarina TaxID=77097 RepID=UPI00384F6699
MLIDAHCHLDVAEFDTDRDAVIAAAQAVGVCRFIVPGTVRARWHHVLALGERHDVSVCLGLHPYFIGQHQPEDLEALEALVNQQLAGAHSAQPVAIGECGIDGRFSDSLDDQWRYFDEQLHIAKRCQLPVVVHCVKANDKVSKRLRQQALPEAGLIHAFAGSYEQAVKFLDLGYVLGLGGAVTYERAQKLRRVVAKLPDDGFVLETDSPDMPLNGYQGQRNEPARVALVAQEVARLRGQPLDTVAALSSANAAQVFKLAI